MAKSRLFATRNDLTAEMRVKIIAILNQQLADTFDLFSQTKQAHWNVKGSQFFQLHELFDRLAEKIEDHVDTIAERATALGAPLWARHALQRPLPVCPSTPLRPSPVNSTWKS